MKTVSIISIVYGTMGIIWAAVVSVVIRIQRSIFEDFPWPTEVYDVIDMPALLETLYGVIGVLFPFVFLVAAFYIASGILQLTGNNAYRNIGYAAAILNIVWYLAYMISIQVELLPILNTFEYFPKGLMNVIFLFGMVLNAVFYCGYAIFLIIFLRRGGLAKDTLKTGYHN
jgi:hypothetical protein